MKTIIKTGLISVILMCLLSGCSSLPPRTLYMEPIVGSTEIHTASANYDVSYSIDGYLMQRKRKDFLSFKIDTMLYTYRLDFWADKDLKSIFDRFFTISEMAAVHQKKNGSQYLGDAVLYAYASFQDKTARLSVKSTVPNRVRFSFLMKDGEQFLLLEGFHAQTIDGNLSVDDYVDAVPFRYADIKKAYDFFADTEKREGIRLKQLQIKKAAKKKNSIPADTESIETAGSVQPQEPDINPADFDENAGEES
ncbi:MAG: hypothetical protein P1P65_05575 [Treponema sp.]